MRVGRLDQVRRAFIVCNEAWYYASAVGAQSRDCLYEVSFGDFQRHPDDGDGGTLGEMGMRWYSVGGKATPRLECYCDAFAVLATFKDVIDALAARDGEDFTVAEFAALLLAHGFVDVTAREVPA